MKRILIGLILAFVLAGCDFVDDMSEIFKKQEIVKEAIKDTTGWESQVSFNMHNGVLTNVSVILDANDVRDRKVSELENVVRKAVLDSFKSTPKTIYIQIAATL